ncbi:tetratricopeptide repeat protein [Chryseobacterium gotjawalense]|uniref:Tetratricopeptide repeat protein n=1 Tax=Chryseobacterium gotjawalense TaxID=3042315 RepID=A0ABY8RD86_9FLAO|nr:tetratricopeptide repeat protein [Chryseobacterium sp. wdc7]WHF51826.1 tetratricopeptide repeat protein [Chryseobacterium sp. wdc7]
MKKIYSLIVLFSTLIYSQNKTEADKKVNEGISLHDSGKFDHAISKYDEALILDKDNSFALTEKAMSLESSKKYDNAIEICKHILKLYPNEDNKTVYITYGNALDHSGKSDLALKVYDAGLVKYPNYYQLYFNKGITLFNAKENEKAIQAFQTATKLNPNHTSSFNALAVLNSSNRIPSILASSRYLTLDNKSPRAKGNLDAIISQMKKGVSQKDDNSISLSIDEETLNKANKNKKTENNFSSVDLVLSMSAALDFDEKNKDKTEIQKFIDKFKSMCEVMKEVKKNQKGYYWEFLVPYYLEMNNKNLIEPFANIIYLSYQNKEAIDYKEKHSDKIEEFYKWSKNYNWK